MNKPILSICLPSYNYPEGTSRIFKFLSLYDKDDIEIIIADNSTNNKVRELYKELKFKKNMVYKHNFPILPPVHNWNYSISLANGKYLLLLHHDEYFTLKDFNKLMIEIKKNEDYDVFITNTILFDRKRNKYFNHLPIFLKNFLISYFKPYIYLKNFIGPTSCLIIKKKLFTNFKETLVWTVDQDWYKRVIFNKTKFLSDVSTISDYSRHNSLTYYIGIKKYYLRVKEDLAYFKYFYPLILLIKTIDLLLWIPFRIIYNLIR